MIKILTFLLFCVALNAKTHELNVDNMGCSSCAKKIENAAKSLPGYKSMSYDLRTKDVNITTEENVKTIDVVRAIQSSKEKKFSVGVK